MKRIKLHINFKFLCLITLFCGINFNSSAQSKFYKTYGGGFGMSISQTHDSSYIISGSGYSSLSTLLVKVDRFGDTLWTKHYGGVSGYFHDAIETKRNGIAFIGALYSTFDNDVIFTLTDSTGGLMMSKKIGRTDNSFTEQFNSILQTSDEGFIISGESSSAQFAPPINTHYVIKMDSTGNILWNRIFEGVQFSAKGGELTYDNGYVFVGTVFNFSNSISFTKMDSVGNILISNRYDNFNTIGIDIHQTVDGGFVVLGRQIPDDRIVLLKLNNNGFCLWSRKYSIQGINVIGNTVKQTNDGGFAILAEYLSKSYLIKTDSSGNVDWGKCYIGSGQDFIQANDDGYLITGYSSAGAMLIKTDQFGNSGCSDSSVVVIDSSLQFQTVQNIIPPYSNVTSSSFSLAYLPADTVSTLCFTTGISDDIASKKMITTFPNPTSDIINFNKENLYVQVSDISGRELIKKQIKGNQLSLKDFSNGIYILKVRFENAEQVFKIVRK